MSIGDGCSRLAELDYVNQSPPARRICSQVTVCRELLGLRKPVCQKSNERTAAILIDGSTGDGAPTSTRGQAEGEVPQAEASEHEHYGTV